MAEQGAEVDQEFENERPVRGAGVASRARVAAAATSGRLSGVVRASLSPKDPGRKQKPLRVRRARRLVGLVALALITLVIAIVAGGLFIAVNLIVDVALVFYMRHLRGVARARQAKLAREKRARAARQAWEQASAQERASQIDGWGTPADPITLPYDSAAPVQFEEQYEPAEYEAQYQSEYEVEYESVSETHYDAVGALTDDVFETDEYDEDDRQEQLDLEALKQPELLDLTDAPTEELLAAKAS